MKPLLGLPDGFEFDEEPKVNRGGALGEPNGNGWELAVFVLTDMLD